MTSGLDDLILKFDVPLPDDEFPELVASLGGEARRRASEPGHPKPSAEYFYLLARTYELLGYCARHTPWLSNSPKFYWQRAVGFFEQAMKSTPAESPQHAFLHGKFLLRSGMIHTLERKSPRPAGSYDLLLQAELAFEDAARKEPDPSLQLIYRDASVISKTEAQQRKLVDELHNLFVRAPKLGWPSTVKQVATKIKTFPTQAFSDLPSVLSAMSWPAQHALAEARKLFAEAHVLEDVIEFLRGAPKEQAKTIEDLRKTSEARVLECYDLSAELCRKAGLTIRAAHTRVTRLRRSAEASLLRSVRQFKTVRDSDAASRIALLGRTATGIQVLPKTVLPLLESVEPDKPRVMAADALVEALRNAGVRLADDAMVFSEATGSWIISDGFDRYHVSSTAGTPSLLDLTKQLIPFSHKEALIFKEYADTTTTTCELYTSAIREIHTALNDASKLYARMASQLESDTNAIKDSDLSSLHVTTDAILKELRSRHYPLLSTLRDRIRYACSLLEMFQMRNGSVRLGTLFSAQCRLIMVNPSYDPKQDEPEDELLEVGADPIFQTTVDFVFRGAKGEEDRHDFQRRALKATITTIEQERQSLLSETRWVDLDPATRRALLERLNCHRALAQALDVFTGIFVVQKPLEMTIAEIKRRLDEIKQHMNDAVDTFGASAEHRSRLIDRPGLDAIHNYMKGIAHVLIGMNQHEERNSSWSYSYGFALDCLRLAKKELAEVGDVYLLPPGTVRDEYLHYMEARILTVMGWQARYRGEENANPTDFRRSAEFFEQSAKIFGDTLHDHRVATKASARATDSRSYLQDGDERCRLLKEANAIYAACGNAQGFNDTLRRLQQEFPVEETGLASIEIEPASDPAAPRITGSKNVVWFGPYEIEELGSGGMADVYRAKKDDKVVALKRVRRESVEVLDFQERFSREADIIKSLNHPNIVRMFDYGRIDDVPYFTMELLAGRALSVPIEAHETFDPRTAAQIAMQIGDALDYAHAKHVVHRDLKPSNVMILDGNRVKVMDFGISYTPRFPRLTSAETFIGTLEYASPEQLSFKEATDQSDLYSLGLIMYEMLTGKAGLEWRRRIREDHPAPSASSSDVPRELDRIVSRLLARDLSARYESAGEMLSELRIFVGPD